MKIRSKNRNRALALLLASVLAGAENEALAFTDNFDANAINSTWWTVAAEGGSTVVASNNRVELTQGTSGFAALTFNTTVLGDFTASIDYSLLNWPANNQERAVLNAFARINNQLLVERISDSQYDPSPTNTGEVYLTDFPGQGILGTSTSDTSGRLRLERNGDSVSGSFWNGVGWTVIGTYQAFDESHVARTFGFGIFAGSTVIPGVKVAFDNFVLDTAPVPLPPASLLLLSGLGMLGWRRIRR